MPKKILVVDDEISLLKLMTNFLSAVGYKVFIASNGWEGIDLAKKEKPDLIITDVRMPIMNGYKMTEELRALPDFKSTPVLIVTGYAVEETHKSKAEQLGIKDYIYKPFDIEEVLQLIKKHTGEPE